MVEISEWLKIKTKLNLLFIINIFQPVLLENIQKNVNDEIALPQLQDLLTELEQEGKIAIENQHFRLTLIGLQSIIPGKGRTMRDIHRMEHLVEFSKQRGGEL
jgi:hypothetical protein